MRADAQQNRETILATAKEQFSRYGSDVSMRSVASEAGVGIGTLYRHFSTRDDLVMGLFEQLHGEISEIITAHSHEWETQEEAEREWSAFFYEMAAMKLGAVAPQLFSQLSTIDRFSDHIDTTSQSFAAMLDQVLTQAKKWDLLREDIQPFQFHLGLSVVTRPLPDLARTKAPDIDTYVLDTYFRGLRP